VRATASASSITRAAIWGGLVAPVLSYFAIEMKMGFALAMMVSTTVFLVLVIIAVALGPETKGKRLTADLESSRRPTEIPPPSSPPGRGEEEGVFLAGQRLIFAASIGMRVARVSARTLNARGDRPMCKGDDQNA